LIATDTQSHTNTSSPVKLDTKTEEFSRVFGHKSQVISCWREHVSNLIPIGPFEWSVKNQALSLSYG